MHAQKCQNGLMIILCIFFIMEPIGAAEKLRAVSGEVSRRLARHRILSALDDFQISETAYSKIYYAETDAENARLVQRAADTFLPLLRRDFGMTESVQAVLVLYPDAALFKKSVGIKNGALPMGAYHGGIVNIVSPRLWGARKRRRRKNLSPAARWCMSFHIF